MKYKILIAAILNLFIISQAGAADKALPYVYSIKYLCGLQRVPGDPPFEPAVKPGNYATSINIHNYHANSRAIMLKKAIVANGIIGPIVQLQLVPNQAINIDCTQIAKSIPSPLPAFIEGFLEIASTVQLSVAAVYTSKGCVANTQCSQLGELALEVVPQQAFRDQ